MDLKQILDNLSDKELLQLCKIKLLQLTEGSFVKSALLVYALKTRSPAIIEVLTSIPNDVDFDKETLEYAAFVITLVQDKPQIAKKFVTKILDKHVNRR